MYFRIFIAFLFIQVTVTQAQVQFEGLKPINGTQLYCKVIGNGPPLLIMHGGPGLNHEYFLPHLNALAKHYTLIFYDQRSSGKSALSIQQNMNFQQFALDIDSIRKMFGYEKINILGHSWGGLLAAYYAMHYSEHVQSLIFCNSVPMNHEFDNEMFANMQYKINSADSLKRAQLMTSEEFQNGKTSAVEPLMMLTFKTSFCDSSKLNQLQLHLPEDYLLASMSFFGFAKELRDYDFFDELSLLKMHALILHGACDNVPLKADEKLNVAIKNSKLVTFKNSGHFPFVEEQKLFTKTLRKFLKSTAK